MIYVWSVMQHHVGVKYNEEKERKAKWDAKQKELARIEDAKKREAEKGLVLFSFTDVSDYY